MRLEITAHLVKARPAPHLSGDAAVVMEEGPTALVLHGMMGQGGGPIVAALAERAWRESLGLGGAGPVRGRLERGIQAIQAALAQHRRQHPEHGAIGVQLAAIAPEGEGVWLGHVGLPRIYRLRGGALQRMTADHAVPGYPAAPMRVLGPEAGPDAMPALTHVPVVSGDRFLLATGGLFQAVPEARLASAFDRLDEVAGEAACAAAIASVRELGSRAIA